MPGGQEPWRYRSGAPRVPDVTHQCVITCEHAHDSARRPRDAQQTGADYLRVTVTLAEELASVRGVSATLIVSFSLS